MHGGQKITLKIFSFYHVGLGLNVCHKAWLEVPLLAEPFLWPRTWLPYKGTMDQIKSLNLLGKDFTDEVIFCQTSATFFVSSSVFFTCSVCLFAYMSHCVYRCQSTT